MFETIIGLAIILGICFWLYQTVAGGRGEISSAGNMVCPHCGTRGESKTITQGSTLIELVLWLCFIIPGAIYSLWRLTSRKQGCPSCGQTGMIPVETPNGKRILEIQKTA
jgi:hypothetical protein